MPRALNLFAAMNVATGQVLTDLRKGHTGSDVLRFFKQIDVTVARDLDIHVVLDNLSAHSTPEIIKWLSHKNRARWHMHPTPTSSSWLNLVERWFKELTDKRLRRGVFTSVADLTQAITAWAAIRRWTAQLPASLDCQDSLVAEQALRRIHTPVSIIFGEGDRYLGPALAAEMAGLFANSALHVVEQAGHYPQYDRPGTVAAFLTHAARDAGRSIR